MRSRKSLASQSPAPIPAPSTTSRRPSVSQTGHLGRKASQQSPLSPLLEETDSATGRNKHPPLPPPPSFSPALPHQQSVVPGPLAPPQPLATGGPPPPPPPPPIIPQKPPMSLNDIIAQHKLKSKQEGKTHKISVLQKGKDDNQFDITEALKTRKPLRKTTKAKLLVDTGLEGSEKGENFLLKNRLKGSKLSSTAREEPDMEYRVLPWRADRTAINLWLVQQGYENCTEKFPGQVKEGSQLYAMDREALREMLGSSDGVRLYSQLQKDKSKSEKEAGIVKETELQKMMRLRKDHLGAQEKEDVPLKLTKPQKLELETVLDSAPGHSRRASSKSNTVAKYRSKHSGHDDDANPNPEYRCSKSFKKRQKSSSGGHREQSYYSDEESSSKKRLKERSKRKRSSKHSDHMSDSSPYSTRGRGRRRQPATNIDDFDENEWSDSISDSEDSYSSEYSESDSDKHFKLRSSASASNIPNATWALQGSEAVDGVVSEVRIKMQQDEIKTLLSHLRELQKQSDVKVLPLAKQSILQGDLRNLEELQRRQKKLPGKVTVLTQLIGQQMLLSDHLREAIALVKEQSFRHQQAFAQKQTTVMPQQVIGYQHPLAQHQLLLEAEQQV
ncbi:hypothetical protein GBAR_LOCUS29145 [Geodia barretti]|nr:hypothetical protein GBAR_LOCUS29145 [Geodia barretti]